MFLNFFHRVPLERRTLHRRNRLLGITVVELLVAGSILLGLSVIFAFILNQARTSSEGGSERIAMRASHRETQKRLSLLLRSAMPPNEVDPAIVEPPYTETSSVVRFHAPADLFDVSESFDPRTPNYPEFTLRWDSGTGDLVLQRSDGSGPVQVIGRGLSSVTFERTVKRLIAIDLASEKMIRSATGRKTIEESSRNYVQIPAVR